MDSIIGKAIDLVCEYTIEPTARQLKYVFCYKSCVAEMNNAIGQLEKEKEIVDVEKSAAHNSGKLIYKKADDWLQDVTNTQGEVSSLTTSYEQGSGGCTVGGQILNPVARHKLGRKSTKKKLAIEELCKNRPGPGEISYDPPPDGVINKATVSAAAEDTELGGGRGGIFRSSRWEETMEEIVAALKDSHTDIIGLHGARTISKSLIYRRDKGMGGVGKSTMIKVVHDQVKKQGMFDEVAKVEVKVKPEIRRIQEEIAFALGLKFETESPAIRSDTLRKRLLNTEKKKKKTVLIILDDLWEKLDLEEIGIPLGGSDRVRIKLFLTSRDEYLLSDKMGVRSPIHLDVLSDADALRMFKFFVGVGAEGDKVAETARKCSGLPIVIEATAKALKKMCMGDWERILKRLDTVDVLDKLKVSYDYLPSKESKELFLLCGIIRGPRIQVRDLLKYTFGLRLYNRKDSSTLVSAADKLEKLLSGLEASSMLLKSDDNRYVEIHDRMRELAARIVEEDRPEWAYDVTLSCDDLADASELKLLLSCCEGDAVEIQDSFLKHMEKLNVLEFRNLHSRRAALSLPTQLDHLRNNLATLCIHNCCLDDISMIGELKGLQILSFRGSEIRKLPIQLRGLTALKMLDLSHCWKLTQIEPTVLASFTKLEELNMENSFKDWEIDGARPPSNNAGLIELRNMSRLRNARIHIPSTSMLPKDGKLFSSKLTTYQIMFGVARYMDRGYVEDSGCYPMLGEEYNEFSRVLMLTFDSPDILWHDWVQATLQTAEVLYLSGRLDGKCESIGKICINGFDCLKHLRMRSCPSFRFIDGSCTNLESLFLENLQSLEKLCGELPKLKVVKVDRCSKLTHLFDFSLLLRSRLSSQLEEITVKGCNEIQCIVDGEGDNNNDEVVALSKLRKMEFRRLRKFSSFCSGLSSNVVFTGKKVSFPCLESLIIDGVNELEEIWHPTDPPAELGNLRSLEVRGCNKLVRVINSNVLMSLQRHLESLSIQYCDFINQVFDVDHGIISSCTDDVVLFCRLKELRLQSMNKLQGIHNYNMTKMMADDRSVSVFPNIELLHLSGCRHLRYALPSAGVGGGYENLKEISIWSCEEMEAIVQVVMPTDAELVLFRRLKQLHLSGIKSLKGVYITSGGDGKVLTTFQDIESIYVETCPGLRYVLCLPPTVEGFAQLRKISVCNCEQMEAIFVMDQEKTQPSDDVDAHHVSYSYSFLKEMKIDRCPRLRTFCQYLCSEQDSTADYLPFFSQKEIFLCLEFVYFNRVSKLGQIWPDEVAPEGSFKMLKQVEILYCPELSVVFPSTLIARLEKLRDIDVRCCGQLAQIIHGGSSMILFTFPCLTTLVLKDLPNLESFHSSSSACCGFHFPCLETLQIWDCSGVKTLFSRRDPHTDIDAGALFRYCDTQAMPNLKSMELCGLENLTQIWKGEKPEGLILKLVSLRLERCSNFQSCLPPSFCSVLTQLTVESCNGLEYLLTPLGSTTSLVHLTSLSITKCNNIKQVVLAVEEENQDHIGEITFSHLKELKLFALPRLERFSSVDNIVLNFPSLEILDIQYCRNMTTFSSGILTTSIIGDLNSIVQKIHTEYKRY